MKDRLGKIQQKDSMSFRQVLGTCESGEDAYTLMLYNLTIPAVKSEKTGKVFILYWEDIIKLGIDSGLNDKGIEWRIHFSEAIVNKLLESEKRLGNNISELIKMWIEKGDLSVNDMKAKLDISMGVLRDLIKILGYQKQHDLNVKKRRSKNSTLY